MRPGDMICMTHTYIYIMCMIFVCLCLLVACDRVKEPSLARFWSADRQHRSAGAVVPAPLLTGPTCARC